MKKVPRDYQRHAVIETCAHWSNGARSVCLVAPTGAGKTEMGMELIGDPVRSLWVAHRRELVIQTADRLAARFGRQSVACVMAGEPLRPEARIQVGTVQTLLVRAESLPGVERLVLDEAHHYTGTEWAALHETYATAKAVGPTATPERRDGTPMGDSYDAMVVAASYSQLVDSGVLVPARVYRPEKKLGADLAQDPLEAWFALAEGAQTFVSCARVDIARSLASRFNAAGVRAAAVSATTPKIERDDILSSFRSGRIRVLTNVDVLTEGIDVPNASCAVLAKSFGYPSAYIQTVGRVIRSAPGKRYAIVIDLCGTTHKHGMPTDDRTYSLEGRAISTRDVDDREFPGSDYVFSQEIVGAPLVLANEEAAPITSPPPAKSELEIQREAYDRLAAEAEAKGLGGGYAAIKFQSMFGVWPPTKWTRRRAAR